jgi:FkbM family methyltransferase
MAIVKENEERPFSPTYPGFLRRMVYFKINQLMFELKNGGGVFDFAFAHISGVNRKKKYSEWMNRGRLAAKSLGISVPETFPEGSLGEVLYDRIYEAVNFIPGKEDTVVDVGAQYGDYSVLCSVLYGVKVIYSFEPIKTNVSLFREFVNLNKIKNINIYEMALSDKTASVEMDFEGDMVTTSGKGSISQVIEFKRLDDLNLSPDFLKIDVEGFEINVLRGAFNTITENMPRIITEVHSKKLKQYTLDFLTHIGYRVAYSGKFPFFNGYIQNLFLEPTR